LAVLAWPYASLVATRCELRVVETDAGELVSGRREGDNASAAARDERGPEQVREHVVAKLIRRELGFPAVPDPRFGRGHDRHFAAQVDPRENVRRRPWPEAGR
jgi:hypothetical protein